MREPETEAQKGKLSSPRSPSRGPEWCSAQGVNSRKLPSSCNSPLSKAEGLRIWMCSAQSLRMSHHPEARLKLQQPLRAGEHHSGVLWDSESASLHASALLVCVALTFRVWVFSCLLPRVLGQSSPQKHFWCLSWTLGCNKVNSSFPTAVTDWSFSSLSGSIWSKTEQLNWAEAHEWVGAPF